MPSNSELELQNIVTPNDECWTTPGEHCGSCMSDQEYADEHGGMGIDVCCTHHKMLKDLLAWRDREVEEARLKEAKAFESAYRLGGSEGLEIFTMARTDKIKAELRAVHSSRKETDA